MADKAVDEVTPAKAPGHTPLRGPHAVGADRGRSGNRIIVRLGISGGPARAPTQAAVPGVNGQGAGRPTPRRV